MQELLHVGYGCCARACVCRSLSAPSLAPQYFAIGSRRRHTMPASLPLNQLLKQQTRRVQHAAQQPSHLTAGISMLVTGAARCELRYPRCCQSNLIETRLLDWLTNSLWMTHTAVLAGCCWCCDYLPTFTHGDADALLHPAVSRYETLDTYDATMPHDNPKAKERASAGP